MDLSNIQPIVKRFENEAQAETYLARLSITGGKMLDVITIYPKGSYVYVWFKYDRNKIGYKKPEVDAQDKAEVVKKKTRKKRSKKVIKVSND